MDVLNGATCKFFRVRLRIANHRLFVCLFVRLSTIIKYLREIDETLLDESKNKQVGSTKEYKLSESKQLGHHGKKNKYKPIFKYYDGDPTLGANEITYEEHVKRIKQFKERKLNLLEQIQ